MLYPPIVKDDPNPSMFDLFNTEEEDIQPGQSRRWLSIIFHLYQLISI